MRKVEVIFHPEIPISPYDWRYYQPAWISHETAWFYEEDGKIYTLDEREVNKELTEWLCGDRDESTNA